jgi:hypothetical protein
MQQIRSNLGYAYLMRVLDTYRSECVFDIGPKIGGRLKPYTKPNKSTREPLLATVLRTPFRETLHSS